MLKMSRKDTNMKKLITILSLLTALTTQVTAYESIDIKISGSKTNINAKLIDSTTYVNLNELSDHLELLTECEIEITAELGENYISARGRFLGGNENLSIDGEKYVPVRSVAKAYGATVEWIESSRSVEMIAVKNSGIEPGESFYISDEVEWLARIINAEAEAEPFIGKILVGNVIMNRVKSNEFPNTIYDVIFDRKYGVQFSPTVNGAIKKTPTADSIAAAKVCLDSYYISTEALYFLNPDTATNFWIPNNRKFITRVGNHEFYS